MPCSTRISAATFPKNSNARPSSSGLARFGRTSCRPVVEAKPRRLKYLRRPRRQVFAANLASSTFMRRGRRIHVAATGRRRHAPSRMARTARSVSSQARPNSGPTTIRTAGRRNRGRRLAGLAEIHWRFRGTNVMVSQVRKDGFGAAIIQANHEDMNACTQGCLKRLGRNARAPQVPACACEEFS